MKNENEKKFNRKRLLIILASVGAMGAIAAIATAASFALFYDPVAPYNATFAAGDVTLNGPSPSATCTVGESQSVNGTGIAPGYSVQGYPGPTPPGLGDQSGTACSTTFSYTGSLSAFLALDVSVATQEGQDNTACNGGLATTTPECAPLYNPSLTGTSGAGLELYVVGVPTNGGPTQTFGIGNDQTISSPGTTDVNTSYSATASANPAQCQQSGVSKGVNCPVTDGFAETFYVYVYWPMDQNNDQNNYMNSKATVTLEEHAVQAIDNPLFTCTAISDTQGNPLGAYQAPNQPEAGWGGGFSSGNVDSSPSVGNCPVPDSNSLGTNPQYVLPGGYIKPPAGDYLMPLYHPDN